MIVLHLLQIYWVKSQGNAAIVVQIYWTHVCPVRPPAGAPVWGEAPAADDFCAFYDLETLLVTPMHMICPSMPVPAST